MSNAKWHKAQRRSHILRIRNGTWYTRSIEQVSMEHSSEATLSPTKSLRDNITNLWGSK